MCEKRIWFAIVHNNIDDETLTYPLEELLHGVMEDHDISDISHIEFEKMTQREYDALEEC